ncbi:MAG: PhzF family phenazine biosynthesis protein [Sphingomonadales bacterium]|nr:PhzF family phenazine biosynthesis protein [Sphingomonadales bacterium]MBD3774880.1 PhzF family phenazine biosynthesis protein [Paracoccaceae bacterium]
MQLDLVDVFGSTAFRGNPLGVVHAAEDLSDAQMIELTRWLNFSETTFILPPSNPAADYRARIFYPAGELPFAGHPTLGTCHAWLEAGGQPRGQDVIVQECGVGLVPIRRDGDLLSFAAPPFTRYGQLVEQEMREAARIAGVPTEAVVEAVHVANGPGWKLLRLRSAEDVLAARPVTQAPVGTDIGLAGPHGDGGEVDWELRAFFANQHGTLVEDPVTGSFNAGVAMHLFASGLNRGSYLAGQGQSIGADGRIHCSIDADGTVWIGGRCDTIARGASLPALG